MQFASSRARARGALSSRSAEQLKTRLNALLAEAPYQARIPFDPVEFPHRYSHPRDIEVAGLLSASLAYGRADLFKPKLDGLLSGMGSSPADFASGLTVRGARGLLDDFVYRFNVGTDIAVLLMGAGRALRERGSLEALFAEGLDGERSLHDALSAFTGALRRVPLASLRRELGPERGLDHLLPSPLGPGAAKRLNMFLRWMVRGPDGVDFGIWRKITASLRKVDPADPVRFDFALCHHGMSGACPPRPRFQNCSCCALRQSCRVGRRLLRLKRRVSVSI